MYVCMCGKYRASSREVWVTGQGLVLHSMLGRVLRVNWQMSELKQKDLSTGMCVLVCFLQP